MVYASKEPSVSALQSAYKTCLTDLNQYFESCERSYRDRRNIWDGKAADLRKHGANSFPWEGASDMEVNTIGERIDAFVAILTQSLDRSHIKAFATSMSTMSRASVVSGFLKWMRSSYIPGFRRQMELGANHLLEKGIMVSYVGWKSESRTYKQAISLEQLVESEEMAPLLEAILDPAAEVDAIAMLSQAFTGLKPAHAKKAVRSLRKTGVAEIPTARQSVDCPVVYALAPDIEVLFPPYTTDPQRAPYFFWRTYMTPQELEKKVTSEGWDKDWVAEAIEKYKGVEMDETISDRPKAFCKLMGEIRRDLILVVYTYQRLIDGDGNEGIYCTVMHPLAPGHAKHELMNGHDDYPLVVTRLSDDQANIYETRTFSDILRGPQMQIKTERDSRIDRASMATMPPIMHPAGRAPSQWGPGVKVPYRRLGEVAFGPTPPADPGSERIEAQMVAQADRAVGLDMTNPISGIRQQFIVNKFLDHVKDVLAMSFKLFQRVGPDEVFFMVTGNPNPQTMGKGSPDDNYQITVSFDTTSTDPENARAQLEAMVSLVQLDRNGKMNTDRLLEFAAAAINPFFADYVLQPDEEAAGKMMKDVTDDLSKIYSGIEVPARPNGAQFALQTIQGYVQQPDVAQRLQSDEAFAARLQKYAEQYQFSIQQMQNAQIGKLGTNPAEMGGVQTQGMKQ